VVFGEGDENYVEIAALNAGADDFLVKPVNKRVFASRLNAWMRRQVRSDIANGVSASNGAFNLDRDRYSLLVRNVEISLQRKEFEILALLASRPRKVFTRKEIKELVWGDVNKARNRTIDVHITNLRAKIGPDLIRTYKGVGYSFDG
jgi:two-component system alkaline phosphatase synthesis response regulator PhoP